MTFRDKTAMAWSNLGRRKVRTFLTSVGVIVGILTLVTMVSLVNGVQIQVKHQFEKIGLDRVSVRPGSAGGGGFPGFGGGGNSGEFDPFGLSVRTKEIAPADVKRWQKWPGVTQVTPEVELPGSIVAGLTIGAKTAKSAKTARVRLGNSSAPRRGPFSETPESLAGSLELPAGRGHVVVSRGALKALKIQTAPAQLIGQNATITLATPRGERKSYDFVISGVSDDEGRAAQVSTGDRLAIKEWWFNEPNVLKTDGYDSVTVRATDVSQARLLVQRFRKEKFEVQSIDAILNVADRIFSVITVMLSLVGGIALFVACIGIVNTMIMAIYERTREIGTLKAMGASRADIRQMFMIEAGLIGLFGGVVGLILSFFLGRGLNRAALWYAARRDLPVPEALFVITPALALAAIGFALLIGMLAGLYPANRAAGLDPLSALRQE